MKTSLYLDSDLLKQAKIKALGAGLTLTDAMESSIRMWLQAELTPEPFSGLNAANRALVLKIVKVLSAERDSKINADVAKILRGALGLVREE